MTDDSNTTAEPNWLDKVEGWAVLTFNKETTEAVEVIADSVSRTEAKDIAFDFNTMHGGDTLTAIAIAPPLVNALQYVFDPCGPSQPTPDECRQVGLVARGSARNLGCRGTEDGPEETETVAIMSQHNLKNGRFIQIAVRYLTQDELDPLLGTTPLID